MFIKKAHLVKGTVTRFCTCAAFRFLVWRNFFQSWLSAKKSSSIDPERPEKDIILVVIIDHDVRYWCRLNIFFSFRSDAGFIRNRERMGRYPLCGVR